MAKSKPQGWFSKNPPSQKPGEGAYSSSSDLNFTRPAAPSLKGTDISKIVDSNAERNGGFAGPLKPSRE